MIIEMIRVTVNFGIDLLSGDLPGLYYQWMVLLLAAYLLQLTLIHHFTKPDEGYTVYLAEGAAAFAVLILSGILLSKFFSFIIEDALIRPSVYTHYFISLIITTAFVAIDGFRQLLHKKIQNKNQRILMMLALVLISNSLSFYVLLPLTGSMFLVSQSFIGTLIAVVSILTLMLYHFEEESSRLAEKGAPEQ